MFKYNPLNLSDGYKVGHKAMLAPGKIETPLLVMQVIYEDGKFYNQVTLDEIRSRVKELSSLEDNLLATA